MRFLCSLQFWPQQLTRSPGLGYRLEPPMRGRALFHPVILALAVLAILSHTCVLPLYAEAHQELVAPHAPQHLEDLMAVHLGHLQIEQDQAGRIL